MLLDIRPTPNLTKQQMWLSLFIVHLKWKNEWPHLTPFDVGWVDSDLNSTIKWFWNGNACGFIWFRLQSWFKIFDNFWIMSSSQSFQQCNDTFSFKICALFVIFATNSKNNEFSQRATEMLMTLSRCSWQTMCVGDIFLLVGDRLCCSHEIYLIVKNNAWVLTSVTRLVINRQCPALDVGDMTFHQHFKLITNTFDLQHLSPTSSPQQSIFWNYITWTLPVLLPTHQSFELSHLTLKSQNLFVRRSDFLLLFLSLFVFLLEAVILLTEERRLLMHRRWMMEFPKFLYWITK